MEAVLPLKVSGDWQNFDLNRAQILIHSIDHFWRGGDFILHIVARDSDYEVIKKNLHAKNITLSVIPETVILPFLKEHISALGWLKQQLIKLAAYRIIKSSLFLTLDADLICTKEISDQNFIFDGKALNDWEPRAGHSDWWDGSAKLLSIPPHLETKGLSVTPQVLSTTICRELEQFVETTHGPAIWGKLLQDVNGWSEYSLYHLFADKFGLWEQFHVSAEWMQENNFSLRCWTNFWGHEDYKSWNPAFSFTPHSPGIFMVCQSSSMVSPYDIWNKVKEYFDGAPDFLNKIDNEN